MTELLMNDTFLKNGSSESTELMPLEMVTTPNINEFPPETLDQVLRLLDENSLRQTRLVCRKWNDLALQILSKTPGTVIMRFEDRHGIGAKGLEHIQKLQSILPFAEYPEMFFSQLVLSSGVLEGDIEIQLFNLLQKFGSTLKSLELTHITLTLTTLRQILDLCTNLEELTFDQITVKKDNNITIQDFETSPTTLRLKLRKFKACHYRNFTITEPPITARHLFASIVKSSPKLQVLHVGFLHGQRDFWEKIQNLPEVTINLVELKIVTFGEHIRDLCDVSFTNKLKYLALDIINASFSKEQLVTFLKGVGESLEKLFLHLRLTESYEQNQQLSHRKIELPLMNKLKELRLSFHRQFSFDSIDFLKNLPNVEILFLSELLNVDSLFSNATYLPRHPHTTLSTLFLGGSLKNPEILFAINRMLPNLLDLTLAVEANEVPELAKEVWLSRIFIGLSEMENLKILHLTINDSVLWDQKLKFEACFSPLNASKSLEDLTIARCGISLNKSGYHQRYRYLSYHLTFFTASPHFPSGLENVFVNIPKLKVLTLKDFHMEQSELIKLFKTLDQSGILLKVDKQFSDDFWNFL